MAQDQAWGNAGSSVSAVIGPITRPEAIVARLPIGGRAAGRRPFRSTQTRGRETARLTAEATRRTSSLATPCQANPRRLPSRPGRNRSRPRRSHRRRSINRHCLAAPAVRQLGRTSPPKDWQASGCRSGPRPQSSGRRRPAAPGPAASAAGPGRLGQRRSKRSSSMTFTQAATKSLTNFSLASSLA